MSGIPEFVLEPAIEWAERGRVPDSVVRWAIRRLCERMREEGAPEGGLTGLIDELKRSPVAIETDAANEQHYEVPARFYEYCLGKYRKYSSCFWPESARSLDDAEAAALQVSCERAGLGDGQDILELGCGWGSLTLWMADHYPSANITAVSNSSSQREHILGEATRRGFGNVQVITANMAHFQADATYDRIVSIEMFEHMRNYEELLQRVSTWLRPEGSLFVHVFCHEAVPHLYETEGAVNWMGRHFFTGGIMPSRDLLPRFDRHLQVDEQWAWDGTHYARTAEAWLENLDRNRTAATRVLADAGAPDPEVALQRWRLFFLACAELFGYDEGREWGVAHYLFRPKALVPA